MNPLPTVDNNANSITNWLNLYNTFGVVDLFFNTSLSSPILCVICAGEATAVCAAAARSHGNEGRHNVTR